MVEIFAIIAYIAVVAVIAYMLFLLWKIRKWFVYRLMPHDLRATAMYEAIRDPYADERILLHKEFSGAVIFGRSLKRLIPSLILVAALTMAPVWYFYGPAVKGPFGVYDIEANAIEDTFISTSQLNFVYGSYASLRIGNVRTWTGFATINDTTFGFVRVPDIDGNPSFYEIGMFRWLGEETYLSDGTFVTACPITVSWDQENFNFIEWSQVMGEALGGGNLLCRTTFIPAGYIGWVWWNLTGEIGTNDTIMFLNNDLNARNAWSVFDSTEGTRSPKIHAIYEGLGPDERPLWMYAIYIAGVLIVGQAVILWLRKRKRVQKGKR